MKLFRIAYDKLIPALIPWRLRGPKLMAWCRSLIAPLKTIYSLFSKNRDNNLYYLKHNSQVCSMQAVLNDRWDAGLRRIKIVDADAIPQTYIYRATETTPLYIYRQSENDPVYLYRSSEILVGLDFIVLVPSFIVFDMMEMRALIDRYRLPSKKNYTINIV